MIPVPASAPESCRLSIGVFAWNEEHAIANTFDSLFRQSLFAEFARLGWTCEVICIANGCTDHTPEVAEEVFSRQQREHRWAGCFEGRVMRIERPGKVNAWNEYVHSISSRSSQYLFMMDADILIHRGSTLWNMVTALEGNREAVVAVDRPCKDIWFKQRKSVSDSLSLAASRMTRAAEAQLCGQLYCIRSEVARDIYLPRDLAACEDGILKALVCTGNLTHEARPSRICVAHEAEHTFEAYTSPMAILRNQKRQVIGQTMVHLLIDKELPALACARRQSLATILREKELSEPDWLKSAVGEHLRQVRFFWQLYPALLTQSFRRLRTLSPVKRAWCFPAAIAWWASTVVASWLAYRTLKRGSMAYWPKARRVGPNARKRAPVGVMLPNPEVLGAHSSPTE